MAGSVPVTSTVPLPRRPLDSGPDPDSGARHWYENDLGWTTVPGRPLRLVTGVRFDVLDVPAEAGAEALRHLVPGSPVALWGGRMRLLVAAGSAEELPELLDWLEWGALELDLRALGTGGLMEAPLPPRPPAPPRSPFSGGAPHSPEPSGAGAPAPSRSGSVAGGRAGSVQGAAVWLRPPEPGCEVEAALPALPAMGGVGHAPDLVRLVDTVATHCHRVRLRRPGAGQTACGRNQPLAFS
ncbi:SCO3374 family protein [Streptomyces sp. NBC_00820]|uniref:SCO3374 family protein n=1 Tax=Streptomyces sp. NBC_00820 TaxID=2975842 RepID=UPI002ED267F5|nr:SCO3374 family protein [Streptomyces sp. NBC_00820]